MDKRGKLLGLLSLIEIREKAYDEIGALPWHKDRIEAAKREIEEELEKLSINDDQLSEV